MQFFPKAKTLMVLALAASVPFHAIAQDQPQAEIKSDRGLTEDRPYTVFYPDVLNVEDDGSETTVITLRHPDAPLQCDVLIVDGAAAEWDAQGALAALDRSVVEAIWLPDFPGFQLTSQGVTQFQSGPALIYEGQSTGSPLGVPLSIVHAEANDGGRSYAVECLTELSVAADARPMVDFILANFSTRSDGTCCTMPATKP
jgi:hypothetical protein